MDPEISPREYSKLSESWHEEVKVSVIKPRSEHLVTSSWSDPSFSDLEEHRLSDVERGVVKVKHDAVYVYVNSPHKERA